MKTYQEITPRKMCSCGKISAGFCQRCLTPAVHTAEEWECLLEEYRKACMQEWKRLQKAVPSVPEILSPLSVRVYVRVEEGYIPYSGAYPGAKGKDYSQSFLWVAIPDGVALTHRAIPGAGKVEYQHLPASEGVPAEAQKVSAWEYPEYWYPDTPEWREYVAAWSYLSHAERFGLQFPTFRKWWEERGRP